ncbi:hypothetical protein FGB62_386g02 [Gracilaria domingensis]|nr:hypothetical protein FGB62_386g02 [Gracilaria domingensis]
MPCTLDALIENNSRQRATALCLNVAKPAYSSRLKLDRRKNVHGDKEVSTAAGRGIGMDSVRFPQAADSDMGDGFVDDEDLFEDQETTRSLTERETRECGDRGRHLVKIPPRSEKRTKKSNIDGGHCGTARKKQ